MSVRPVRLHDWFDLPRLDKQGHEVRDVMPWEGAVAYATDGKRIGVQYADGRVEWLGEASDRHLLEQGSAAGPLAEMGSDFDGIDLDALVTGIRAYMDRHPILQTVWRDDLAALERLRRQSHD